MPVPPRHSLAWLSEAGWQSLAASHAGQQAQLLAQWRHHGWPTVVRRRDADARDAEICLGIPGPPDPASGMKQRLGFRVPADAVERVAPPLSLQEIAASLPDAWQPALRKFSLHARDAGIAFRVYGSAALEHLTGLPYLTAGSDMDMLLQPTSVPMLLRGLELLTNHAAHLPLDGEIAFPGQQCVAWKEWRQAVNVGGRSRVLVKDARQVRLARVDELLEALEQAR